MLVPFQLQAEIALSPPRARRGRPSRRRRGRSGAPARRRSWLRDPVPWPHKWRMSRRLTSASAPQRMRFSRPGLQLPPGHPRQDIAKRLGHHRLVHDRQAPRRRSSAGGRARYPRSAAAQGPDEPAPGADRLDHVDAVQAAAQADVRDHRIEPALPLRRPRASACCASPAASARQPALSSARARLSSTAGSFSTTSTVPAPGGTGAGGPRPTPKRRVGRGDRRLNRHPDLDHRATAGDRPEGKSGDRGNRASRSTMARPMPMPSATSPGGVAAAAELLEDRRLFRLPECRSRYRSTWIDSVLPRRRLPIRIRPLRVYLTGVRHEVLEDPVQQVRIAVRTVAPGSDEPEREPAVGGDRAVGVGQPARPPA